MIICYNILILGKEEKRMKICVVRTENGKYISSKNTLVGFGQSRVFKRQRDAIEYSNNPKRIASFGKMYVLVMNIEKNFKMPFMEVISRLNGHDEEFAKKIENYKCVAVSEYGYLKTNFKGYYTLEQSFSKNFNKASVYKNPFELIAVMNIKRAFMQTFEKELLDVWEMTKSYTDSNTCERKFEKLLSLMNGENIEIGFLQES